MNTTYKCILVPIDLDHESSWQSSLPAAIDLARRHDAQLTIITIVPDSDIPTIANYLPKEIDDHLREEGANRLNQFIAEYVPQDIRVQSIVGQGRIYSGILHIASDLNADLIVMASHNPGLADYLIGANAEKVMRHAQCSVMVVRNKMESKTL